VTCMTCKWADGIPGGNDAGKGICRYAPPVGVVAGMTAQGPILATVWPQVNMAHDWCHCYEVQLVKPANGSIHLAK
jgi:cellulase/cellobiase CelA1